MDTKKLRFAHQRRWWRVKEPKSLQEIHKIREKHYKETKGMTIHQKMIYYKKKAQKVRKANTSKDYHPVAK